MAPLRPLAVLGVVLGLAACGGSAGGGRHATSSSAPGSPPGTAPAPPGQPPAAFAAHLLRNNELSGFVISDVAVYRTAGALVSSEQQDASAAGSEMRMLIGHGFRVAAREDLDHHGVAGLSLVERLGSPSAARAVLRFYVAKFHRVGGADEYAAFPVAGVPGAVGFRLGGAGSAGSNVAFTRGDYYYLLGEEGSGPVPEEGLSAAARSLYRRAPV